MLEFLLIAATIEVSPGDSLQAAVDQAVPGDTIEVAPGVYPEKVEVYYKDGSPGEWLVIRGATSWDEERPVIEAPDPSFPDTGIEVWQSSYVRIEGLEIRNFHFGDGIRFLAGTGFELSGCDVHHNADDPSGAGLPGSDHLGSGVAVDDDTFEVVIARNMVHDNGASTDFDHGMYLRGTGARVENNLVWQNTGYGIQVYPHAEGFVVANNVVAFHPVKSGIILYSAENHDNRVFNNLGWQNAQYTVNVGGGAFDNVIENNMGFGDGSGVVNDDAANTYLDNTVTDPLFVDAAGFDFALADGSPAIGAGLLDDAPADDFYGRPRPTDELSLGAIEFLDDPGGDTGSGSDGDGSGGNETGGDQTGGGPGGSDGNGADAGSGGADTSAGSGDGSGGPDEDDTAASGCGCRHDPTRPPLALLILLGLATGARPRVTGRRRRGG